MPIDTSGERRALSDFADVILNDTEDGVNVVIENRDKMPYVLDFNFSQTENMTLDVFARDGAKLTDIMKVSMEVPAGSVKTLGDFHLINDDVDSLVVSYRVRCRIRNPTTGKIEKCPTARNQELDNVPEIRIPMGPSVDLVAKQAPSGYVCYLENKGNTPVTVSADFSPSVNHEVQPLDTRVKQSNPDVASITVPPNGTIEFVEVGPKARGPFKFNVRPLSVTPASPAASADCPKTVAATITPSTSTATTVNNTPKPRANVASGANVDNEGFDEFDGGSGGVGDADEEEWDAHDGGSGGFGDGGGGGGAAPSAGFQQHGGGAGGVGGGAGGRGAAPSAGFQQHGGGAGGVGGGDGGRGAAPSHSKAPTSAANEDGPDVSAFGAGGPAAGQNQFINDAYLTKAFPNIHRDFGPKGKKDASPNCRNWTAYRWVLKEWEDERLARIKIEAEWKVRFGLYLKQWHQSVCNICRNLVVEGTATELVTYKEFRLHKICYERAEKCDMCKEILVGEYVIAKGTSGKEATKLHSGACVDEYRKRSRPCCYICKQQIMEDRWGTSAGQPFHFNCKK